jgi:hypothetical protein
LRRQEEQLERESRLREELLRRRQQELEIRAEIERQRRQEEIQRQEEIAMQDQRRRQQEQKERERIVRAEQLINIFSIKFSFKIFLFSILNVFRYWSEQRTMLNTCLKKVKVCMRMHGMLKTQMIVN